MIDESTMYWITRLDKVSAVLSGLAIALGIIGGISSIVFCVAYSMSATDADAKVTARIFRWISHISMPLFLVFLLGWALTPTTKEYAAIKLIPAIVNNGKVQDEAREVYELVKDWLKDKVEAEMPPDRSEKRK
jgi:hypothetical protein